MSERKKDTERERERIREGWAERRITMPHKVTKMTKRKWDKKSREEKKYCT